MGDFCGRKNEALTAALATFSRPFLWKRWVAFWSFIDGLYLVPIPQCLNNCPPVQSDSLGSGALLGL